MNSKSPTLERPSVYQFKFGDSIITNLLEGHVTRDDLHPFVAKNATADEVESLARRYQLPYPKLEHGFVTTLIQTPDALIAFDPGFGENTPMPSAGFFNQSLNKLGFSTDDIDLVVISHSHPDHIGNLMTNNKPTFTNAQIVYGRTEFEYWKRGENISDMRKPTQALFEKVALPLEDRIRFIEPGDTIAPGLTAVNAFGHSAGHMAFQFERGNQQLLLLNDTVAHYVASFAYPHWAFSMDDDPEMAAKTRYRLLDAAATDNIPVIGFHLPFPSIGFVERHQDAFEFRPVTYQFNV